MASGAVCNLQRLNRDVRSPASSSSCGQSTKPLSKIIFQTERFSQKQWRPMLWQEADIVADPNLIEYEVSGP
jgi:hypothetical protein